MYPTCPLEGHSDWDHQPQPKTVWPPFHHSSLLLPIYWKASSVVRWLPLWGSLHFMCGRSGNLCLLRHHVMYIICDSQTVRGIGKHFNTSINWRGFTMNNGVNKHCQKMELYCLLKVGLVFKQSVMNCWNVTSILHKLWMLRFHSTDRILTYT